MIGQYLERASHELNQNKDYVVCTVKTVLLRDCTLYQHSFRARKIDSIEDRDIQQQSQQKKTIIV